MSIDKKDNKSTPQQLHADLREKREDSKTCFNHILYMWIKTKLVIYLIILQKTILSVNLLYIAVKTKTEKNSCLLTESTIMVSVTMQSDVFDMF